MENWSSYSFVHSKAQNRLLPSRAEDLVYVYTNLRVLNQNVPFIDEAAIEWYMQTIVSKDSDSKDLWTFLMIMMMFLTLIHQICPLTMRIFKGNLGNMMGCNNNLRELERMGGTSQTRMHAMRADCTMNHQENASKACLRLILLVVMHH